MDPVTTTTQTAPANTSSTTPVQAPTTTTPEPLITRVSRVSTPQPENGQQAPASDGIQFNVKDFEKIADPVARKLAEDAYKSMQADYTRKTQAIAAERATLKSQLEASGRYTPERIAQMLADPSFIQAAQAYQSQFTPQAPANATGELTQEEFQYLSPEQQKLYAQQKQTQSMLANLQGELSSIKTQKEDTELTGRYSNYQPQTVNKIYEDMMTGRVQATREHLWKVVDYEDAVKRAYQLGQQDAKQGITTNRQASSIVNGASTPTMDADVPQRRPGQSHAEHWRAVAESAKVKLGIK